MTFGLQPLWDAPLSFQAVLIYALVGLLLAVNSAWFFTSGNRAMRIVGRVGIVVAVLWYALIVEAVRRFGIQWVPDRWDILAWRADLVFVAGWLAVSGIGVLLVRRYRRDGT